EEGEGGVMKDDVGDCQACGACCFSHREGDDAYVPLTRAEGARMRRLGLPVIDRGRPRLGTVPFLGLDAFPACAAFEGDLGGPCSCSVYGSRPGACRRFEPGSPECDRARRQLCIDELAGPVTLPKVEDVPPKRRGRPRKGKG